MGKRFIKIFKNGKLIEAELNHQPKYKVGKVYSPLAKERIIGIDTESLKSETALPDGRTDLRTISVQMQTHNKEYVINTIDHDIPFTAVFDSLWEDYSSHDVHPEEKIERKVRQRKDGDRADGRRVSTPITLLVFYNLGYDIGRLWHLHNGIRRTIKADLKNVHLQVGEYDVEVVTELFRGSCPGFEYYVRKDKKVLRLMGMDIGAYWKGGLDKTAKSLIADHKTVINKEIFQYSLEDFIELSEQDHAEIKEFWEYAAKDARLTRDVYLATVELLASIKEEVVRRNGLLPQSAPGAAAKIAFSMGPAEWEMPTATVQQAGAYTYCGARVFNRKPAYYNNVTVVDINSAYPHIMTQLPDPAECVYEYVVDYPFVLDIMRGKFGCVCISGRSLDDIIPAIRCHDPINHRLQYVYGEFKDLWVTIPEAVIGIVSGTLEVDHIKYGFIMHGSHEDSFLRNFVYEMHVRKNNEKKQGRSNSAMYLATKLLMNSLYGKLVEVKLDQNRAYDEEAEEQDVLNIFEKTIIKANRDRRKEKIEELTSAYANEGVEGIRRIYDVWTSEHPEIKETIPFFMFRQQYAPTKAKTGQYFLGMHGANITGFVSAKLGLMLRVLEGIQGDTDSVMTNLDKEGIKRGFDQYYRIMKESGYDAPAEGLGAFEVEVEGGEGYFVKNKLYAIRYQSNGETKYKIATHGISGLTLRKDQRSQNPNPDLAKLEDSAMVKEVFYQMAQEMVGHKDQKIEYNARSVSKTYSSFIRDMVAGEFLENITRTIQAKDDPNQWIDHTGARHWWTIEDTREILPGLTEQERKEFEDAQRGLYYFENLH